MEDDSLPRPPLSVRGLVFNGFLTLVLMVGTLASWGLPAAWKRVGVQQQVPLTVTLESFVVPGRAGKAHLVGLGQSCRISIQIAHASLDQVFIRAELLPLVQTRVRDSRGRLVPGPEQPTRAIAVVDCEGRTVYADDNLSRRFGTLVLIGRKAELTVSPEALAQRYRLRFLVTDRRTNATANLDVPVQVVRAVEGSRRW
ncbi:MAG: hypothetical protein AB1758_07090 [Candidatus Eremiobacterota bacterium]